MEEPKENQLLPGKDRQPPEPVVLKTYRSRFGFFAGFLICTALLLAAFAVSAVWMRGEMPAWTERVASWFGAEEGTDGVSDAVTTADTQPPKAPEPEKQTAEALPEGNIRVVTADLSSEGAGADGLRNLSSAVPDVSAIRVLDAGGGEIPDEPFVLILHSHACECYLAEESLSVPAGADAIRSRDGERNVLAVGETFCGELNKKGVPAIHCTVTHDDPTLGGSSDRAAESIAFFLEFYPSIRYVIDIGRDTAVTADGEYIRSLTEVGGVKTAQIKAVVGTDGGGEACPSWRENLALALCFHDLLNGCGKVCRPVELLNSVRNQNLAPRSMLLEIGTAGNTVTEAKRAAVLAADALAVIVKGE